MLTLVSKIDEVVGYVDWAIENKFGVIDVNIPSYLENENVSLGTNKYLVECDSMSHTGD